ncbi:MAG TPA: ABC transporter ATP-binding protein [Candidatus Sulfotelmatobacter sp.]|nr:ABC transporter ATP-binding protein [Candidatus Sulfotelmatobacter sp.]
MLKVDRVSAWYDKVQALKGVSLEVNEKEIVTVIGANGAGKSTLLATIMGLVRPRDGTIEFLGRRIDRLETEDIVCSGLYLVPEGRRIFPGLTVMENLEMGAVPRGSRRAAGFRSDLEEVFGLFPVLKGRRAQLGWSLSGGEQQMLAIGRGLMARPKLLLLDEPSLGLAPVLVEELFRAIVRINQAGMTLLLVEQNAFMALNVAKRGYVFETGRCVLGDAAEKLLGNDKVKKAYLGA